MKGETNIQKYLSKKIKVFIFFSIVFLILNIIKKFEKNHQTSPPDSPDDFKKSKIKFEKIVIVWIFSKNNLLTKLSQTAYVNGLTL